MAFNTKIFLLLIASAVVYTFPADKNYGDDYEDDNNIVTRGVTFFQVRMYLGYIIVNENVEVDTVNNFVVVQAPPVGDYKAVTIFHDYNLNMTLAVYPASKHCYLFDKYSDVPDDMSYWFGLRDATMTAKAFDGKNMRRYKNHVYVITDDNADKTILTTKMRQFCTDDMQLSEATMTTEDEMSPGSDELMGDFKDMHLIVMPFVPVPGERVRRRASAASRAHLCGVGVYR